MVSVVTKQQITNGTFINVSPITTMALELTSGKQLTQSNLDSSVSLMSNSIFLGADAQINPFITPALLTSEQSNIEVLLQHRTVIESFAMLLSYLADGTEVTNVDVLKGLTIDLQDKIVDGKTGEDDVEFFAQHPLLLEKYLAAPVRHLPILGSDKGGDTETIDPYLLSEVGTLILGEQPLLGSELTSPELESGTVSFMVSAVGLDSDFDVRKMQLTACQTEIEYNIP